MRYRIILLTLVLFASLAAQKDWPMYGHDPGVKRFSPLNQINTQTVSRLQRAWTFLTVDIKRGILYV